LRPLATPREKGEWSFALGRRGRVEHPSSPRRRTAKARVRRQGGGPRAGEKARSGKRRDRKERGTEGGEGEKGRGERMGKARAAGSASGGRGARGLVGRTGWPRGRGESAGAIRNEHRSRTWGRGEENVGGKKEWPGEKAVRWKSGAVWIEGREAEERGAGRASVGREKGEKAEKGGARRRVNEAGELWSYRLGSSRPGSAFRKPTLVLQRSRGR
jgi:hypothetical protein